MNKWYIIDEPELKAYSIMKRQGILENGKYQDEKVCTIYSMDYLDVILDALEPEDRKYDKPLITNNPIIEG